jgi:hypothetical protein
MNNAPLNASLDILFNYICFSCYYYYPNKANKKKIKELFNALPFFLPMQYQNTLYKLIKKYPIETLDCNIIGTKNILELVKKHKCKFILTSTSEVYGDPLEHPQQETYYGNVNTVGERSCYDESKRCAETYVYIYRQLYKKK